MASAWYGMQLRESGNLRVMVIAGCIIVHFFRIFGNILQQIEGERTVKRQAELPPKNYESGGREFESLRARH
jgi:hypothetical protein